MAKRLTAKQRRNRTYTVGLLLLLVVGLVWAALWGLGSNAGEAPAETSPTEASTPSESEPELSESPSDSANYEGLGSSGLPDDAPPCEIDAIQLQALTDKDSYGGSEPVMMRFMIVNTGDVPCQINAGTTEQDYVISRAGETVFRSSDCMSNRVDQLVTLEPDEPRETAEIEWNRRYSDEDSCGERLDSVTAGGTEYTLTVVLAGIESQGTHTFVLR